VKTPQIAPLAGMTPLGLKPPPASEKEVLGGVVVEQGLIDGVPSVSWNERALAEHRAKTAGRRGNAPMPAGGLFDEVAKAQGELF
jgi:hypothetical protein